MTKTILVTGASAGIGRATARKFLAEGWQVGLMGRREEALKQAADGHKSALTLVSDVTDPAAVGRAVSTMVTRFGRIDALFNNAGMSLPARTIDETPVEDWIAMVNTNLTGSFLCARAVFAQMRKQDPQGGRIINNGSVSAHVPRFGSSPYTTTKHAITGLTRSLSLDGRAFNIACGQIDIGNALTDMSERMTRGVPQADGSIAVEPVMDVAHVADMVFHMASLPLDANVQFVTVMATRMPYIGRG